MLALLSLAFAASALAQSIPTSPATPIQLEGVDAGYVNEGFPGTDPTIAFGVPLHSQALLTIVYGTTTVANEAALTAAQVAASPSIYITPSTASVSNFSSTDLFTLVLADASSLGSPDPLFNYRHYLANSVPGNSTTPTFELNRASANVVTFYAGPGPAAGQGPHRYAWLLFQQPTSFTAPSGLTGAGHWQLSSYVSSSGLGPLVAASYFTVENGPASYSVAPVSTVDSAALPGAASTTSPGAAGPTTTGGSSSGGVTATTGTGSPAATSSPPSSSANGLGVKGGMMAIFAVAVLAVIV